MYRHLHSEQNPTGDAIPTKSNFTDDEAIDICRATSKERTQAPAIIPMARRVEALWNAELITAKTAHEYTDFEIPEAEMPALLRLQVLDQSPAQLTAQAARESEESRLSPPQGRNSMQTPTHEAQ